MGVHISQWSVSSGLDKGTAVEPLFPDHPFSQYLGTEEAVAHGGFLSF